MKNREINRVGEKGREGGEGEGKRGRGEKGGTREREGERGG